VHKALSKKFGHNLKSWNTVKWKID
jgi:hypothetical protein